LSENFAGGGYVGHDDVDVGGEAGVAVLLDGVASDDQRWDACLGEDAHRLAHGAGQAGRGGDLADQDGPDVVGGDRGTHGLMVNPDGLSPRPPTLAARGWGTRRWRYEIFSAERISKAKGKGLPDIAN
jgi:hypothetical protein